MNQPENSNDKIGIFGLPTNEAKSQIILLPVPWEVTTSYGRGASQGPRIILQASEQVDLFDLETGNAYHAGYFLRDLPEDLWQLNVVSKAKAQEVIRSINYGDHGPRVQRLQEQVNLACEEMSQWVYQQSKKILDQGKLLGIIGGDHSTPLGALRALSEKHQGNYGVLHFDAHADLRCAYQGFRQSHASIMHNLMTSGFKPKTLVQVGIRDFCEEEFDFIKHHPKQIKTFFDLENKKRLFKGTTWAQIAEEIVHSLPENVYVSFDIDGLDPALCPNTGTPVAGGLSLDQAFFVLATLVEQKKKIIGFDLNEVSCGELENAEWDGNVGARLLYKLCGWCALTNKKP